MSSSSRFSSWACTPGPAATVIAAAGAAERRPVTRAPASVAISHPAARSHGLSPDSK